MSRKIIITFLLFVFSTCIVFGQYKQTVRGRITDKVTSAPLPAVTIIVNNISDVSDTTDNSNKLVTCSDTNGDFIIKNVPVGRNNFLFSFIGYEPVLMKNITVNSGKELFLNVEITSVQRKFLND